MKFVNRQSILASGLVLVGVGAYAGEIPAACKPVVDALAKIESTPSHAYNTTSRAGKTQDSEVIHSGNSAYVLVDGKWTTMPIQPGEALKQVQENLRNAKSVSCRLVKDETIDGQISHLYETVVVDGGDSSNNQMWISKSSGLPVHQKIQINPNGADKASYETRFDYSNVQAPPISH